MLTHPKLKLLSLLSLVFLQLGGVAEAHRALATNIAIDVELTGDLLVIEPWVPTFLLPPLQDITLENQDSWPLPEDRRAAIEEYFDTECPVEIDGVHVKPVMQKLSLQPMPEAKHLNETIDFVEARIVLNYQAEAPPQKMKLRWSIYPPVPEGGWGDLVDEDQNPQEFDNMMFIDNKEDFVFFSPEEPEFYWHRKPDKVEPINVITEEELSGSGVSKVEAPRPPLIPLASIVAIGTGIAFFVGASLGKFPIPLRLGGLGLGLLVAILHMNFISGAPPPPPPGITEARAVDVFEQLQKNLYSAFDFDSEDQVYDVLAQSVDGKLLDDFYTEIYQSLLVVEKSSAVAKVHDVEVLEINAVPIDPAPDGTSSRFDIFCHWRVHGVVKHFEHIHRRVNEYRADYRLTRKPDGWKITGVAVSEQQRLDPKTMKPSEDYN